MTENSGIDSTPSPSSTHAGSGPRGLATAASVTVFIHGVGATSSREMLSEAVKGYVASGLGTTYECSTLPECPVLSREKGASAVVLEGESGHHFLIALPWADRRIRLAVVARTCAIVLLVFTLLAAPAFLFPMQLESLIGWLRSTWHRLVAYGLVVLLSAIVFAFRQDPDKNFKRPGMSILLWPIALVLIAMIFSLMSELFWLLEGVLILALSAIASVIVLRCVPCAPSLHWRLALLTLVLAMGTLDSSFVRVAWHLDRDARSRSKRYEHDEEIRTLDKMLSLQARQEKLADSPVSKVEKPQITSSSAVPQQHPQIVNRGQGLDGKNKRPSFPRSTQTALSFQPNKAVEGSDLPDLRAQQEQIDKLLNPGPTREQLESMKPKLGDLLTRMDYLRGLLLAAVGLTGCLVVLSFNWILDLVLDVLNYVGNARLNALLVEGTCDAIDWLHGQAPGAEMVVVGHSLGSVPASHAVAAIVAEESMIAPITLVTLGSPLNYLWRLFPREVQSPAQLSEAISKGGRWVNLWRRWDFVGKAMETKPEQCIQYRVGEGGGHTGYFADAATWRAVVWEALRFEKSKEPTDPGDDSPAKCFLETRLWTLVLIAVPALLAFGIALWII
jgi:hypothetical protein